MLRRMFSGSRQGNGSSGKDKKHRRGNLSSGSNSLTLTPQDGHVGKIKRQGEEERFASGMPEDHPSLADKIDSHRSGNLFKYAVITNKPSDERSEFFSRLRVFKPQVKEKVLTLSDIPAIRLIGDAVEFDLSMALSKQEMASLGDYILIDCVLIHYIPLDSFANDKSVVTIQMNDFRKLGNSAVRRCKVDSTMGYNILFTLDYCVEKVDITKMTVSFTNHSKEFQEGVAWGAVKVVAQLMGLSFPKRVPLIDTMGVMIFADTDLQAFECDPRELDLIITPDALRRMRLLHQSGEIENKTMPTNDKKEISTARTVIGVFDDQDPVDDQIEKLKEEGLKLNRKEQNVRSILRNTPALKKKLEGKVIEFDEEHMVRESDDTGKLKDLDEVLAGDSWSEKGDDDTDVTEEVGRSVGFKNLRTVD